MLGIVGLPLAIWRSVVSHRQSNTAQSGLLNERYQQSAEMLGSDLPAVRLGGIYALTHLAREHPRDYQIQIVSLLCAFVRHPTDAARDSAEPSGPRHEGTSRCTREDVQTILTALGKRSQAQKRTEVRNSYRMNLIGADLTDVRATSADLKSADLVDADLRRAHLRGAQLDNANLTGADLTGADLTSAMLNSAILCAADLTGATVKAAKMTGQT